MLTWLLVNIALSVLALVFIKLSTTAPHRLRFFAGFAALVAWLVPWALLPSQPPVGMFSAELLRIERAVEAGSTRVTDVFPLLVERHAVPMAQNFVSLSIVELFFVAVTCIGCVLFVWKLAAHRLLLRQLEREADDGNWLWARAGLAPLYPVSVQSDVGGAFSSGLLRPRIWVHGDLVHSSQFATVLNHEVTHIRQHDNWYLLVITLVERLLWWSPLVWYLGRCTRELLELSCDEACQRADAGYATHLAQLMLESARSYRPPRVRALGANIFGNPNPNLERIKLMERSYPMLTRHVLGAAFTAATAFLAVGFATAQPDAVQATAGERAEVFTLARNQSQDVDLVLVHGEGATGRHMLRLMRGVAPGNGEQFLRIDAYEGEQRLSFNFTDTPLPRVLMPLAGLAGSDGMPLLPMTQLPPSANRFAGVPDEDLATIDAARSVQASGGSIASQALNLNDRLVLEYAAAADRLVSVAGADLTLDEALDQIAAASGCNILRDDATFVVDNCEE